MIVKKSFDLDERLIEFASLIIDITEMLPKAIAAIHLSGQLVSSGTAPALNYAEAQGAESRKDFIHKMKIALKELRETYNCLRIIQKRNWVLNNSLINAINENNQLISIFVKSIDTAQKNNNLK
jgi:Inactivated superfamily I helicase